LRPVLFKHQGIAWFSHCEPTKKDDPVIRQNDVTRLPALAVRIVIVPASPSNRTSERGELAIAHPVSSAAWTICRKPGSVALTKRSAFVMRG